MTDTHVHQPSAPASASLHDLREVLEQYRTCELATIGKAGTPIAWPAVPILARDGQSIVLTTSIGLPQKAYNIRRDPRVALLFSDPTGTGRRDLPQVLVQGTASCPDVIHSSPAGLEDYWARLARRQPSSRNTSTNLVTRRLMGWYYLRLVITVSPVRVTERPPLSDLLTAPEHPTTSRSTLPRNDHSAYMETARRLPTYHSAVLGLVRGGNLPVLHRVHLTEDPGRGRFLLDGAGDRELSAGPASILLHRHDDELWDLHTFGVVGDLVRDQRDWAFVPQRAIPGTDGLATLETIRAVRQMKRTADGYLSRRHLPRPAIAWKEFQRLSR